jgi:threonine aldolase
MATNPNPNLIPTVERAGERPERVELAASRPAMTPKEQFTLMAELCDQYGVEKHDVYGDFTADATTSWVRKFERQVSERLGTEDGIFVVSGTMSQSIAAKIHEAAANHRTKDFVCHYTSHVLLHEQNSYPTLLNLNPVVVLPNFASASLHPLKYRSVHM